MGYTHYWTPSKTLIPFATISLLTAILKHGQQVGVIETDGNQAFKISEKQVFFNGVGEDAHETFHYKVSGEWNFCKTNNKPYDVYVCATLLILRYYVGIKFSSDGGVYNEEWNEAINFLIDNRDLEGFNLDKNFIKSLEQIRYGDEGYSDLFKDFPLFGLTKNFSKEEEMIINATQHRETDEQYKEGVRTPYCVEKIRKLITFDDIPTVVEMKNRAMEIAQIIYNEYGNVKVMIGGAPFFMSTLESSLIAMGLTPVYSFSERVVVEETMEDGSIKKTSVFRHKGFVEVF